MTGPATSYIMPTDTLATANLRATAHGAGTAACMALLLFAAELALDTPPAGTWRNQAKNGLAVAGRVPAGEPVEPAEIVQAMQNENDEGPLVYMQLVPPGPQAQAWNAIAEALGYAAWHACLSRRQHPNSLIEGYASPDSLDFAVNPFIGVPALDWDALGRVNRLGTSTCLQSQRGLGTAVESPRFTSGRASGDRCGIVFIYHYLMNC